MSARVVQWIMRLPKPERAYCISYLAWRKLVTITPERGRELREAIKAIEEWERQHPEEANGSNGSSGSTQTPSRNDDGGVH